MNILEKRNFGNIVPEAPGSGFERDQAEGVRHVFRTRGPGVYRVEARLGERPWIFANPIYLRP